MCGPLKKSLGCWILVCSILVCGGSYGQTLTPGIPSDGPKPQGASEQKKSSTNQRGTEQAPFVIKILESEHANEKAASIPNESDHKTTPNWWPFAWWPTAEGWLALFTLGLFIATCVLAGANWMLVKGAEDTAKWQLRAYIYVDGEKEPLVERLPGSIEIHLVMKNVGQTPAFKMTNWALANILPFPLQTPLPSREFDAKSIYLPPSAESKFIIAIPVATWNRAELDAQQASRRLYIWGEVRFEDAFGKTQFVTFQFMLPPQGRTNLDYCAEGNDATQN